MQFRRSGQRDERRRRVLMDETLHQIPQDDDAKSGHGGAVVKPRRYSEAAKEGRQPPVTCLIPKRPWTLLTLGLTGLLGVAVIQNLYTQVYLSAPARHQSALAGLDVTARGSIGGWYASLLLGLAAVTSVLIFALRRHRLDDYRGRYRAWLWIPAVLLLASLDAATGLHAVLATLLAENVSTSLASPAACQLALLWTVFGIVGLRVCWEVWASRLAVAAMMAAASMYVLASLIELNLWLDAFSMLALTAGSACQLLGHLAVAATAVAYCRFVYLEAQSASSPPRPSRKVRKRKDSAVRPSKPVTSTTENKTARHKRKRSVRVDAAHQQAAKPAVHAPDAEPEPQAGPNAEESQKQLSKSERRRLRKQMRKQARGAADGA